MAIGQMSETVEVTSMVSPINTTDASLGNTISGNQIRSLPLEARNVVGLLSLQPGAVYLPHTANTDPRSGSVSGSRADQSNVTLDGVDVNDPQFGTAYTSALRVTTDALQEFRVATSNYGADTGRSSAAQVSLVTKSGTNIFHGSGTYTERDTKFSSKEYFLGLSGQDKAKLDKKIGGGAVGGPIKKDKLFFFGNYERLQESSESPVNRARAVGHDAGWRAHLWLRGRTRPARGPACRASRARTRCPPASTAWTRRSWPPSIPCTSGRAKPSPTFNQYPALERPGPRRLQHRRLPIRVADRERVQHLRLARVDYRATPSQSLFVRLNFQNDASADAAQFPDWAAAQHAEGARAAAGAIGHDWVLGSNKVNTFRYGYTDIVEDSIGLQTQPTVSFRFIDDFSALTATSGRQTPTHNFVDDFSWIKGNHTLKFGTNMRFTRVPRYDNTFSFNSGTTNASWMAGLGRYYSPGNTCPGTEAACAQFPAVGDGFQATFADTFAPLLGIVSETDLTANYNVDGSASRSRRPTDRKYGSDEYEFYAQDSWKVGSSLTVTGGLRYSLYSPPWEVNGQQVAPSVDLGTMLAHAPANMAAGIPDNTLPLMALRSGGPGQRQARLLRVGQEQLGAALAAAWSPHGEGGLWQADWGRQARHPRRLLDGLRPHRPGAGHTLRSGRLVRPFHAAIARRSTRTTRTIRPSASPASTTFRATLPPCLRRLPADAAGRRRPDITSALDSSITTPYSHVYNIVVGRELGGDYSFEAAYVGRTGRNQLIRRDLLCPQLQDKKSGTDYFTAAKQMIDAMHASGDPLTIAPIPYWENLFPTAAFDGHTATQNMAPGFPPTNQTG